MTRSWKRQRETDRSGIGKDDKEQRQNVHPDSVGGQKKRVVCRVGDEQERLINPRDVNKFITSGLTWLGRSRATKSIMWWKFKLIPCDRPECHYVTILNFKPYAR